MTEKCVCVWSNSQASNQANWTNVNEHKFDSIWEEKTHFERFGFLSVNIFFFLAQPRIVSVYVHLCPLT